MVHRLVVPAFPELGASLEGNVVAGINCGADTSSLAMWAMEIGVPGRWALTSAC